MFEFFFEVLQKISELNLSDEELAILSAVILFRPGRINVHSYSVSEAFLKMKRGFLSTIQRRLKCNKKFQLFLKEVDRTFVLLDQVTQVLRLGICTLIDNDSTVHIAPLLKEVLLSRRTEIEETHQKSIQVRNTKFDEVFQQICATKRKKDDQSFYNDGHNRNRFDQENSSELKTLESEDLSLIIPLD